jgi:hypothetical protein
MWWVPLAVIWPAFGALTLYWMFKAPYTDDWK